MSTQDRLRAMYANIRQLPSDKATACALLSIRCAGTKGIQRGFRYIDHFKAACADPEAQLAMNGFADFDEIEMPPDLRYATPEDFKEMIRGYAVAESLLAVLDCEQVTCDGSEGCACDLCMITRHLTGNKGA
jgi:hypothetical protein